MENGNSESQAAEAPTSPPAGPTVIFAIEITQMSDGDVRWTTTASADVVERTLNTVLTVVRRGLDAAATLNLIAHAQQQAQRGVGIAHPTQIPPGLLRRHPPR